MASVCWVTASRMMRDSETRASLAASLSRASVRASRRTLFMGRAYHEFGAKGITRRLGRQSKSPSGPRLSEYERHRALQEALDFLQELRRGHPIEDPVIDRERDAHPLAGHHQAVFDDRLVFDRADRQDARIGRVDDGGELVDVVHPEVRDAEGVAEVVLRRGLVRPGALDQLLRLLRDLLQRLLVGVVE